MHTNKYIGECVYCGNTVPAGTGIWNGSTTCADIVEVPDGYGLIQTTCKNNEGALKNFFASKNYVAQHQAIKAAQEQRKAEFAKAKAQRIATNKQLKADGKCTRCGGQGHSDNWIATGSVCFKCNGTGKEEN
jgi:hypothetical protein